MRHSGPKDFQSNMQQIFSFRGLRIWHLLLLGLSLFFLASGGILLYRGTWSGVPLVNVEVRNNRYLTVEEVKNLANVQIGEIIGRSASGEVQERLEALPSVTHVTLSDQGDGRLVIELEEQPCAAIIRSGSQMFDVASDLTILSTTSVRCRDVPVVVGSFSIDDGHWVDKRLKVLFTEWDTFRNSYPLLFSRISEIRIDRGNYMTVYLARTHIRILMPVSFASDISKKLYASIAYFEKEKGSSGIIDLRGPDAILLPE